MCGYPCDLKCCTRTPVVCVASAPKSVNINGKWISHANLASVEEKLRVKVHFILFTIFFLYPNTNPTRLQFKSSRVGLGCKSSTQLDCKLIKWGSPGTISTDTRTLEQGQWFFAVTGERFDAHDFITPDLYSKGYVKVIGNWVCHNWDKGFVYVQGDNSVFLLEKMGSYSRNRFHGCLIGVTSSVGKTTTRIMIALALEGLRSVHQSCGNWNNQIGVALSVIGSPRSIDMVVLELGMNEKGGILELGRTCQPSVRVILNFGSLEDVSMAKGEILREAKPRDRLVRLKEEDESRKKKMAK